MIENAGIPLPGETMMIAASVLAARGQLDPYLVIASGTTGAVIGDNAGYWIGRIGGRKLFDRVAGKFSSVDRGMRITEKYFHSYGGITVLLARFIAGVRVFAGPLAGISLMDFKRFLFFNTVGALVWAGVLVFGIRHLGTVYAKYIRGYENANAVICGLLFAMLILLTYRMIKKLRGR